MARSKVKSYNRKGPISADREIEAQLSVAPEGSTDIADATDEPDQISETENSEIEQSEQPKQVEPDQVDIDGDGHDDRNGQFVDGNQEAAGPRGSSRRSRKTIASTDTPTD